LEKIVKTAKFEYTHGHEVDDSSLATGVYYNSKHHALAVEFHDYPYGTPSAFYGGVPESAYRNLINARSLGAEYNASIKDKYVNLSNGTIYNVYYSPAEGVEDSKVAVKEETDFTYMVHGYVRHQLTVKAKDREEARNKFLDSLTEEGYDASDLAVTEVVIVG
jgi:hypothetical protein